MATEVRLSREMRLIDVTMIGVGAIVRAIDKRRRLGAVAEALAGLGLVFLGISLLGDAFGGVGDAVDHSRLRASQGSGPTSTGLAL